MSATDQHISITISLKSTGIARAGFGLALIISYSDVIAPDITRRYSNAAAMVTDGFASDSPEVLAAEAQFNQTPCPTAVLVGRAVLKPTLKYTVNVNQLLNTAKYELQVDGQGVTSTKVSVTSEAVARQEKIHNDLVTGLDAVVGKNFTAAFAPLATNLAGIVVTADPVTDELDHVAHGWNTGDGPIQFTNAGGALPAGIVALTDYYVVKVDADHFKIATTLANAFAGTIVDITDAGTGVQTATPTGAALSPVLPFTITANAAGDFFAIEALKLRYLKLVVNNADPGIATDLADILLEDNSWYALVVPMLSSAMALSAAQWVESAGAKIFFLDLNESDAVNTAAVGGTDTLAVLLSHAYKRTLYSFHHSPLEMMSSAWLGVLLPKNPGTWTAKFKSLDGVTVTKLDDTQRQNLIDRRANAYTNDGVAMTWEGTIGNTSYGFIDVVDGLDWWFDDAQKSVLGIEVSLDKIGYDDHDIATVGGALEASVQRGVSDQHRLFAAGTPGDANDPAPAVTVPLVRDIDPSVRALRQLPNMGVSARLEGAVHKVFVNATFTF